MDPLPLLSTWWVTLLTVLFCNTKASCNGPTPEKLNVLLINGTPPEKSTVKVLGLLFALIKMRSNLYDQIGGGLGIGKLNMLASFALFYDNPAMINTKRVISFWRIVVSEFVVDDNFAILPKTVLSPE